MASSKAKKLVDCAIKTPGDGLATLAVSFVNAIWLQDLGTEVITLQNYVQAIENCVNEDVNVENSHVLHTSDQVKVTEIGDN